MVALVMAIGLCSGAGAAEIEVLRDGFDGATSGRLVGTAAFTPSPDGEALKLEGRIPPTVSFDFTNVHLEMAVIAEKLGRLDEAAERFEEALRRSPDHPGRGAIRAKIKDLRRRLSTPP